MSKLKIYVETTIISYLASFPSRELIVAARQKITHNWWATRRNDFDLYVSQLVIDECSAGDPQASAKRIEILNDLELIASDDLARDLARRLLDTKAVPQKAIEDAVHIATAAAQGMDILLTWNCKHIANAEQMRKIIGACADAGFECPTICTPDELFGDK